MNLIYLEIQNCRGIHVYLVSLTHLWISRELGTTPMSMSTFVSVLISSVRGHTRKFMTSFCTINKNLTKELCVWVFEPILSHKLGQNLVI